MDAREPQPPPSPRLGRPSAPPFGVTRRPGGGIPPIPEAVRAVVFLTAVVLFVLVYVYALEKYGNKQPAESTPGPLVYHFVDDAQPTGGFIFVGGWEHVTGEHDGRSDGTSTRSFNIGARATITFVGRALRVFGITGPNGGTAAVTLDGRSYGTAKFHSVKKDASSVVFQSPVLSPGSHTLSLIVEPPPANSTRGYVNIDGAAYAP